MEFSLKMLGLQGRIFSRNMIQRKQSFGNFNREGTCGLVRGTMWREE